MARGVRTLMLLGALALAARDARADGDGLSRVANSGQRIVTTSTTCTILDIIEFVPGTAVVRSRSIATIDAVADTLKGNPSIQLVEVQGHTDERGDDAENLDLTDRQAHAVRTMLIARGVSPHRLEAQGYGETQPVDTHHNAAAWKKNRRIAFLIRKRASD